MADVCFRVGRYVEKGSKTYRMPCNTGPLYKGEKLTIKKDKSDTAVYTVKGKLGSARWKRRFYDGDMGSYIGHIRKVAINQLKPKRAVLDHNKKVKAVVRRSKVMPAVTKSSFEVVVMPEPCGIDDMPSTSKLPVALRIKGNTGSHNWKVKTADKSATLATCASIKKRDSVSTSAGPSHFSVTICGGVDHIFILMLITAVEEMNVSRVTAARSTSD